jgi:hypothetical protein
MTDLGERPIIAVDGRAGFDGGRKRSASRVWRLTSLGETLTHVLPAEIFT